MEQILVPLKGKGALWKEIDKELNELSGRLEKAEPDEQPNIRAS